MNAAIAPKGSYPFLRQIQESPIIQSSSNSTLTEKEPPCSQELQDKLNEDGKKIFKVIYRDKDRGAMNQVTVAAENKEEALLKFKRTFSLAMVTKQDNFAAKNCIDKPNIKKPYRWDRNTEPTVYSEEEFAFLKAS